MDNPIDIGFASDHLETSGSFKRHLAGMIDASIILALSVLIMPYLPQNILYHLQNQINPEFYILLLLALYRLTSLFIFDATIGMLVIRIKLLNVDLKILSTKEKTCAAFFILINDADYYTKSAEKAN